MRIEYAQTLEGFSCRSRLLDRKLDAIRTRPEDSLQKGRDASVGVFGLIVQANFFYTIRDSTE
jgi:hypothetical protein